MAISLAAVRAVSKRRWPIPWPVLLTALLGLLTTLPYVYAAWTVPIDHVYTGLMLDAPDTLQYFSWMRDHRSALLVSNRMTAQPNDAALFNVLWLVLGQLQNLTGWGNAALFQVLRLLGGVAFAWAVWWCFGLLARTRREQGWAWAFVMCGGGLGVIWVIEKYLRGLPDVRYPFDLYVAEPNTLLGLLGYPHFLMAGALVVATFGAALRAARGSWYWWCVAAGCALLLALQHAYDLLTVYAVLGGWICLLALKQWTIPWRMVWGALLVGVVSFPPAGYFAWLTSRDPLWRAVLSQFTNAGVWTPNPPHLLLLMGLPLMITIVTWDGFRSLQARSDGELLIKSWAIAGLGLIYLPVSFQIHLLNPWQVPLALLAVWGIERRLVPVVVRHWSTEGRWLMPLIFALTLPTNMYLVSWRFVELARHTAPYYLHTDEVAALTWLEKHTTPADVVLSELELGQFVAAQTDARAVLAHWAQTVDFYRTSDDVQRVLDAGTSSTERLSILQRYGVSFVLAPHELHDTTLIPVWHGGSLITYAVRLER